MIDVPIGAWLSVVVGRSCYCKYAAVNRQSSSSSAHMAQMPTITQKPTVKNKP